jgi:hypothetical protein
MSPRDFRVVAIIALALLCFTSFYHENHGEVQHRSAGWVLDWHFETENADRSSRAVPAVDNTTAPKDENFKKEITASRKLPVGWTGNAEDYLLSR